MTVSKFEKSEPLKATWQDPISMAINIPLLDRLPQFETAMNALGGETLQDVGLIDFRDESGMVWRINFGGRYPDFLSFIEYKLKLDFRGAVNWALEFIQNTAPDFNDDGCKCEPGECTHGTNIKD